MNGQMMQQQLLISSLLVHAERHQGEQEIVSRRVEGDIHRCNYRELAVRSRRMAKAMLALGVKPGQRDPVFDAARAASHGLHQGQEAEVEKHHLVFSVVGDVDHLVGVQARVQCLQHGSRAADAEVQLHVAVAVPGQ